MIHRVVSLCFVWLRNWINHSPLAPQQLWVHPRRGPRSWYSGWCNLPCTTEAWQSLSMLSHTRGAAEVPGTEWFGPSPGRPSKKFPFYHKPMSPSFAGPEKQKGTLLFVLRDALPMTLLLLTEQNYLFLLSSRQYLLTGHPVCVYSTASITWVAEFSFLHLVFCWLVSICYTFLCCFAPCPNRCSSFKPQRHCKQQLCSPNAMFTSCCYAMLSQSKYCAKSWGI